MLPAGRARYLARHRVGGALEGVHTDHAGQQAGSDHLTLARAIAFVQRGDHAVRAIHAGHDVSHRHTDPGRLIGAGSGHRHDAGLALGDLVITRAATLGAVVAEAA